MFYGAGKTCLRRTIFKDKIFGLFLSLFGRLFQKDSFKRTVSKGLIQRGGFKRAASSLFLLPAPNFHDKFMWQRFCEKDLNAGGKAEDGGVPPPLHVL